MDTKKCHKYVGHVLFEGSSTAKGYGDEAHQMGYAGRLEARYHAYNDRTRAHPEQSCRFVYTHMHGQPDKNAVQYVQDISSHASEARRLCQAIAEARLVGVFVVGAYMTRLCRQEGEERALLLYRNALERLEGVCEQEAISPVLLAPPGPQPDATFPNGTVVPLKIWQETIVMSSQHAERWRAPFVSLDEVLGADKPTCMAPDGIHMNAKGYSVATDYIAPFIDEVLGIPMTPQGAMHV